MRILHVEQQGVFVENNPRIYYRFVPFTTLQDPFTLKSYKSLMSLPIKAFIGLGSNIGNRRRYLTQAITAIHHFDHTKLIKASPIYETPPVGITKQRFFYNAVCLISTSLSAETLILLLKHVEKKLGRKTPIKRWLPREIDLDILLYGNLLITQQDLIIPHPKLHDRKFVLAPLLDIENPVHPKLQKHISELMATTKDQSEITRIKEKLQVDIDEKIL